MIYPTFKLAPHTLKVSPKCHLRGDTFNTGTWHLARVRKALHACNLYIYLYNIPLMGIFSFSNWCNLF